MTTDPVTGTAAVFDAERPRLVALAYRMLGTPDDADDVVQDAWLRWAAADHAAIATPAAWLTTVTTRLAIDRLRSAQRRREVYVGPWLPEPVAVGDEDAPYVAVASADSLTLAFLTVLERLQPVERAVLLLHDVFGYPFTEVAASVGRSEPATRQIARRARERVRSDRPAAEAPADPAQAEQLSEAFLGAMIGGDMDTMRRLLADDVVHVSDGGPHRRAARRPVVGTDKVARLLLNLSKRAQPGTGVHPVMVNGECGWYVTVHDAPELLLVPSFQDGLVTRVFAILNPDKLARFHTAWLAQQ